MAVLARNRGGGSSRGRRHREPEAEAAAARGGDDSVVTKVGGGGLRASSPMTASGADPTAWELEGDWRRARGSGQHGTEEKPREAEAAGEAKVGEKPESGGSS